MTAAPLSRRIAPWSLMLLAVFWGSTFFSIKGLLGALPAADLLAVRFTISTAILVVVLHRSWRMSRTTLLRGVVLGVVYGSAQLLQTVGLGHTSASISGFLTGLYVVFTPVIGLVAFRVRVRGVVWAGVGLALVGLGLLALRPGPGGLGIGYGDLLTIACAVIYAAHIALLGHWSTPGNAGSLTVTQAVAMTVVFWVAALPGGVQLPQGPVPWLWMLYLATFCGAAAIFLQTWAQGYVPATRASVIMCSEPLWATFFAILFGGEGLTIRFVIGAAAILAAMYVVIRAPGRTEG